MKIANVMLVSTLLMVPVMAIAAEDAADAKFQQDIDSSNASADSDGSKLVCRKESRVGTRIKEMVCRTQRTVDANADDAKRYVNRARAVPSNER